MYIVVPLVLVVIAAYSGNGGFCGVCAMVGVRNLMTLRPWQLAKRGNLLYHEYWTPSCWSAKRRA